MNDHANQSNMKGIIFQLIGFAIKHRKIMQSYLDQTGVFQSQHRLLMKISHDQNVSQKDLAAFMEVSAATIAVSLKKLEKGGYIKKVMDQEDNRLNHITITEKGKQVVEQSKQIFHSTDQKIFEGFTEEEMDTLSALLKKLDANLAKLEDEMKSEKGKDSTQ